jgi:transposase
MATGKVIGKLLKFKGFKAVDLAFKRDNELHIAVKPFKNGCQCLQCGRRGKIVRIRPEVRWWRDIPVGGWTVWFMYAPREIQCPTHGRVEERLPWADQYARVTYRYEYVMLRYCQMMTQKAAAGLLRISASTLSDQLHRCISWSQNTRTENNRDRRDIVLQGAQVCHAGLRSGPFRRAVGWRRER